MLVLGLGAAVLKTIAVKLDEKDLKALRALKAKDQHRQGTGSIAEHIRIAVKRYLGDLEREQAATQP
jgi:hypothetical protein